MTREQWKRCYRAARLLPHKNAISHAFDQLERDGLLAEAFIALRLRTAHVWRCGVDCAKVARANGRSFSKAISLHLRAVKHRRSTRYDPLHNPLYRRAA